MPIDAAPVVGNLDHDPFADRHRTQRQHTFASLPLCFTLRNSFKPMTDSISHEVHERIHHPLTQKLVNLLFAAAVLHDDLLAALTREIANHEGHAFKDLSDLDHASDTLRRHTSTGIANQGKLLRGRLYGKVRNYQSRG